MKRTVLTIVSLAIMSVISSLPTYAEETHFTLDKRSAQMGAIGAFAEMVHRDVKKLALGSPAPAADIDVLLPIIAKIVARNKVTFYRESDFLVTDLFPASVTDGLDVILIYTGTTLDEYQALKARKAQLVADGAYEGEARKAIAYGFGRLLSYPDKVIAEILADNQ